MKILIFILLISGCQIHTGIGVRPESYDNSHLDNMSNPVFRLVAEKKLTSRQTIFYEHLSSIPDDQEDEGINTFGWMYQIK